MWIDISMPLHKNMAVWPGDRPFRYTLDATLQQDGANVGAVELSLHAGTHVDAPYHYDDFGKSIDTLPIDLFVGEVAIFDATAGWSADLLSSIDWSRIERVFFKTTTERAPMTFSPQYEAVPLLIVEALRERGVRVIGTDAPSVDAFDAHDLPVHHACKEAGMYIIENLQLQRVTQGVYDFIGLPLAIQGGDASPIRAIIKPKVKEMEDGNV